jgi:hypothetical protein
MKRIAALGVLGILWGVMFAGAEDAKVMPGRVGRVYVAPTYAFANGAYNDDGEYKAYDDVSGQALKVINLGFAVEYGVMDWITAALQWAPGWNVWSEAKAPPISPTKKLNANGVYDLFAGAKLQIIGETAPVQSSLLRLAFAPGVKIPLPGPDFKEQAKNMNNGDDTTAANADKHVLGVGTRAYFDYVINENFFINLYGEFIWFPLKGELEKSSLGLNVNTINLGGGGLKIESDGVDYGYDLTFELEPVFSLPLGGGGGGGISVTAGRPVNYKMSPGVKYNLTIPSALATAAAYAGIAEGESGYVLSLKPNVSFFFTGLALPTEVKVQYSLPLLGKNERAAHSITLQAKLYFRI